jgi:hypothetical protein
MPWLLRALVVCVFALNGLIILGRTHHTPVVRLLMGLLAGLVLVRLSSILGNQCKKLRARYPLGAKRAGTAIYIVGNALAAICVASAAFGAYQGVSQELIVLTASMSILYWAAGWGLHRSLAFGTRSPILPRDDEAAEELPVRPARSASLLPQVNRRQWKIALSLAIVGALVAPFSFGTYKARPTSGVKLPVTPEQKARWTDQVQGYRTSGVCESSGERAEIDCDAQHVYEKLLKQGYVGPVYRFDIFKYLAVNIAVAAGTFISVFLLALLVPMLARAFSFLTRRYWKWLDA